MMKKFRIKDAVITVSVLLAAFGVDLLLLRYFDTRTVTPMIFVRVSK